MADYEIHIDTLQTKESNFQGQKGKVDKITESYNGSSIKKAPSAISKVAAKITKNFERLQNGYQNSDSWFSSYLDELNALEASLASFSCENLNELIEFTGTFEDIFGKVTMPAIKTGGDPNCNEELGSLGSENLIKITIDGQEFYVVDTNLSVEEYAEYIKNGKMYQNAGLLGGQCNLLSQYYARDMIRGKTTSKSDMASTSGAPAVNMKRSELSQDINDIYEFAYNEINAGRPVVLQVTQVRSNEGLRHFVTMVGYTPDVKSASDLNPDNMLVLDCVDGELQTLGKSRSDGGHERQLFNQGGRGYYALAATNDFLATVPGLNTAT